MGFIGFYWVLLGFTGFYWVLLGFTGFNVVLLIYRFEKELGKIGGSHCKKKELVLVESSDELVETIIFNAANELNQRKRNKVSIASI